MAVIEGSRSRPFYNAGAPVDGTSGTFAGIASKGALLLDTTNGKAYVNTGTQSSPVWTVAGTQS